MRRRDFLELTGTALAAPAFHQEIQLKGLPRLDGALVREPAALTEAAGDLGGVVERRPVAVLRPASAEDVVRMVRYANQHRLPIVMRGRGHSVNGQSLAGQGIVIDSRPLRRARVQGRTLDVEAGASLADAAAAALDRGLALPVMSPCTMLSVGGFLSVGGESFGTRRHGTFADQVASLDVVTGAGTLVTCSAERESELFEMTLAGMGQCGLIVRARLGLVPAPDQIATRVLTYQSVESFLHHQIRLATDLRIEHVSGQILPHAGGTWRPVTTVTTLARGNAAPDPIELLELDASVSAGELVRSSYRDYVLGARRPLAESKATAAESSSREAARPRPAPEPSLAVWLPARAGHELVRILLATPRLTAGAVGILCRALPTALFHRPLFRVPDEDIMLAVWIRRSVPGGHGPGLGAQLEANTMFLERALALGGKRYPPCGGEASPDEWRHHYGEVIYRRFAAAKRRYDPERVLTPGVRVFESA